MIMTAKATFETGIATWQAVAARDTGTEGFCDYHRGQSAWIGLTG